MAKHENKSCPRCSRSFECKVGSILQCQCNGVAFTDNEWDYIRQNYADCLCRNCLQLIKHEISTMAMQQRMQKILAQIKNK